MPTDKELLIKDLMHKCDCLYRENSRLKEMVSTQPLKAADKEAYEALLSDKDAIIAQKEAKSTVWSNVYPILNGSCTVRRRKSS